MGTSTSLTTPYDYIKNTSSSLLTSFNSSQLNMLQNIGLNNITQTDKNNLFTLINDIGNNKNLF